MNLAIKGHSKRGNEVIEILEMLGGRNPHNYCADCDSLCFTIGKSTNTIYYDWVKECYEDEDTLVFTLEEFLEKFPYKVGDKVYYKPIPQINSVCISEIISMRWIDGSVVYYTSNCHEVYACDLQSYKEETMEDKLEQITFDIPDGYEFFGINDDNQVVLAKKKPQYPKTYEECCNVLGCDRNLILGAMPMKYQVLINFQKLLICRDAYCKIAGEEMGLDKPWEPDYTDDNVKYIISIHRNHLDLNVTIERNYILIFPTAEMRDTFYENFKDLIEQCKELL